MHKKSQTTTKEILKFFEAFQRRKPLLFSSPIYWRGKFCQNLGILTGAFQSLIYRGPPLFLAFLLYADTANFKD